VDRALAQRAAGDFAGALHTLEESVEQVPDDARAVNLLGVVQQELRQLDAAERSFRRAIALQPDFADAHFNLGMLLLARGEYAEGWREYEWRTRRPAYADYANYPFGMPRWQGESLSGKTILVHAEQGFGDTLQAARFLEPLARTAAAVDVFCQPSLVSLMQRVRGVRHVHGTLAERPMNDFHAPMLDLAAHFLPTIDAPHWFGPYISARPARITEWASRLESLSRPRIGIAWKGSARHVNDRMRSLNPHQAVALRRAVPANRFVNLQMGEAPPEGAQWFDAGTQIRDWDDTAAIMESLDMVVAVDTAVAHLAGAMGKTVWMLRPFTPEWRWGFGAETTLWYPTMRLFWQPTPGAWNDVLQAMAERLADPATCRPAPGPARASPP
jgi:hypothetical protein